METLVSGIFCARVLSSPIFSGWNTACSLCPRWSSYLTCCFISQSCTMAALNQFPFSQGKETSKWFCLKDLLQGHWFVPLLFLTFSFLEINNATEIEAPASFFFSPDSLSIVNLQCHVIFLYNSSVNVFEYQKQNIL